MSMFMRIDGIEGESSDKNHKGWIDILKFDWGTARNITSVASTQGDRESSNAVITDLKIIRRMDKATPKLFIEACCGRGKDISLHLTKTGQGSGADTYMEFQLKNALISQYRIAGHAEDVERPNEEITISFVDLQVRYTSYDEDGNLIAPIAVGFNTATNLKA